MVSPWEVCRTVRFAACAEHVFVDEHPGLLIGRRNGEAWVLWVDVSSGDLSQEWVSADRVRVLDRARSTPDL